MKKIYINNTKHAIFVGETMLLPGSNVCEAIDTEKEPVFKKMLDDEIVEETSDTARAVKLANTQDIAMQIMAVKKDDKKTKSNGDKRIEELNKIDKEAEEAKKGDKDKDE